MGFTETRDAYGYGAEKDPKNKESYYLFTSVYEWFDIDNALVATDDQTVHVVKNSTSVVQSSTSASFGFEGKRARLLFRDDSTGDASELYRVTVRGKALVKKNLNRTKAEVVADTRNIATKETRYIFDATSARAFATQEKDRIKYGDHSYSWASKDDVAIGSIVALQQTDPLINTNVIVTGKAKNKERPLYHYTGVGCSEFSLATVLSEGDTYFTASQLAFFADSSISGNHITIAASDYYYSTNRRCDGVGDEVEINAAITKLDTEFGGGVVNLSPGTFATSSNIVLKDNVILEGAGMDTIINGIGSSNTIEINDGTLIENVIIRNLKITGGAQTYISIQNGSNIIISECILDGESTYCLRVGPTAGTDGTKDVKILKNRFTDIGSYAIFGTSCNTLLIADNTIIGSAGNTATVIYLGGATQKGIVKSNVIKDVGITTRTTTSDIIFVGSAVQAANTVHIIDNQITDCYNRGGYLRGMNINNNDNIIVSGNTIANIYDYDIGARAAIYVDTAADFNKITNNNCYDNGNLIDRGNCESTTAPMVLGETVPATQNASGSRSDTQAYQGTYSWKINKDTAAAGGQANYALDDEGSWGAAPNMHGLVAGLTYKFSAYVYRPTNPLETEVFLYIGEYYGATWNATVNENLGGTSDAWSLYESEFTLNATTTAVTILFYIATAAEQNEFIYIDNIRLLPVGIHNEHDQQFVDSGTGTQLSGNSWQNPFGV